MRNQEYAEKANKEVEKHPKDSDLKTKSKNIKSLIDIIHPNIKPSFFSKINKVYFAKNIRVLGPEGRKASKELITKVIAASNVSLRGLILPNEILVDSDIYKEKVSVARALAVRKLWSQNGVDISNIKILHYNPDLTGRSVEVYFNG